MDWAFFLLFCIQLIVLFFISRLSIRYLFYLLRFFTSSDTVVYSTIAFLFLPGTILHELSHFLMAIMLLLKVREIHIFPQWEQNYIKLGRVLYEKQDVFRSILVGIAPIIVGLLFFWWLSLLNVFQIEDIFLKVIIFYIIFVISSTMFSSQQDLVDLIYIIPVILMVAIIQYFFPINFSFITSQESIIQAINSFIYDINWYLFISTCIHAVLVSVIFILLRLLKK